MRQNKLHYKMYKSGKKWMFAAIAVTAIGGIGYISGNNTVNVAASANVNNSDSNTTNNDSSNTTSNSDNSTTKNATSGATTNNDNSTTNSNSSNTTSNSDNSTTKNATSGATTNSDNSTTNSNSSNTTSNSDNSTTKNAASGATTNSDNSTTNSNSSNTTSNSNSSTTQNDVNNNSSNEINNDPFLQKLGINANNINNDNILRIASLFHIFANDAQLRTDTNGNFAVKNLSTNVDFGARGNSDNLTSGDIYYIQSLNNNLPSAGFRNTSYNRVAIGKNVNMSVNDGKVSLNGVIINSLNPDDVTQDKDNSTYINFDEVFNALKKDSNYYSSNHNSNGVQSNFNDMNNRSIDVTNAKDTNGIIYANVPYDYLNAPQPFTIKGISDNAQGNSVVLNVTGLPDGDANITTQTKLIYSNGSSIANGESHQYPNKLLWNFGNGDQNINFDSGRFMGSILAPNATVNIGENVDGNVVANRVSVSGGESHRWDIHTSSNGNNNGGGSNSGSSANSSDGSSAGSSAHSSNGSSAGSSAHSSNGSSAGSSAHSSNGSSAGSSARSSNGSSAGSSAHSSNGSSAGSLAHSSNGSSAGSSAHSSNGSSAGSLAHSSNGSSAGSSAHSSNGFNLGSSNASKGSGSSSVTSNSSNSSSDSNSTKLPQTGEEQKSSMSIIGVLLVFLSSLFGLVSLRRNKDNK